MEMRLERRVPVYGIDFAVHRRWRRKGKNEMEKGEI